MFIARVVTTLVTALILSACGAPLPMGGDAGIPGDGGLPVRPAVVQGSRAECSDPAGCLASISLVRPVPSAQVNGNEPFAVCVRDNFLREYLAPGGQDSLCSNAVVEVGECRTPFRMGESGPGQPCMMVFLGNDCSQVPRGVPVSLRVVVVSSSELASDGRGGGVCVYGPPAQDEAGTTLQTQEVLVTFTSP